VAATGWAYCGPRRREAFQLAVNGLAASKAVVDGLAAHKPVGEVTWRLCGAAPAVGYGLRRVFRHQPPSTLCLTQQLGLCAGGSWHPVSGRPGP
jgi:hypothetical protein